MENQVLIVDDDADVRDSMRVLLESGGHAVKDYASAKLFLSNYPGEGGCVISDIRMPEMGGLELQEELVRRAIDLPLIIMTGHGDVPLAVRAMKAGAIDFIEKPFHDEVMLQSVDRALKIGRTTAGRSAHAKATRDLLALLTPRERDVLDHLLEGHSNKVSAYELGISSRTIEIHRARVMRKMQAGSLADLVRAVLAAQ